MDRDGSKSLSLQETRVNTKLELSALWAALMFLYIYVDHFALFLPGVLEDAIAGEVGGFQVTQTWLVAAMALMTIPSLMIPMSLFLKAKASRRANIVAGAVYALVVIGNTIGESWIYYIGASVVEFGLLVVIVWTAWTWPKSGS
jgi:hypothetical protein